MFAISRLLLMWCIGFVNPSLGINEEEFQILEDLKVSKAINVCYDCDNLTSKISSQKLLSKHGYTGSVSRLSDCQRIVPKSVSVVMSLSKVESFNAAINLIHMDWGVKYPSVFLIKSDNADNKLDSVKTIKINQQILFVFLPSLTVYEAYTVNEIQTVRRLSHFERYGVIPSMIRTVIDSPIPYLLQRRSNFHGIHFRTMVEKEAGYLRLDPDYKSKARFFENNRTYDVTGMTYGLFPDLLTLMEKQMNFTTTLYKREDGIWGVVNKLDNGSYSMKGMIANLANGEADFVATSFAITYDRMPFAGKQKLVYSNIHKLKFFPDYLPPIVKEFGAFFIKKDRVEAHAWTTYSNPLALDLWMGLWLSALVTSALLLVIEGKVKCSHPFELWKTYVRNLWLTFSSNFGGGKVGTPYANQSHRVAVVTFLLSGSVIWMSYRASMTSELSVLHETLPFSNPTELAQTDY